jgi:uroporphyrinogen-III synthase
MSRPVAVLRPEPGNRITADQLAARGLAVLRLPLFAVRPLDWAVPDPAGFDALVLTSANALRHGGAGLAQLRGLPVHAVGAATASAAAAAGFRVVAVGTGGVAALMAAARAGGVRRALHLGGRDRIAGSDAAMAAVRAVYASEPLPPPDVARFAGAVALLHSPRAAARLAAIVPPDRRAHTRLAAMGGAVAGAAGAGWAAVRIATDAGALLDAAQALAD